MFKNYIAYLKDNPNNYWFKRKLYGWGWTPAKWEGWVVIALFLVFIMIESFLLPPDALITTNEEIWFFVKIILAVGLLIGICYTKGEKPKWQWGVPKK